MITKKIRVQALVEFTIDEHNIIANKTIMDANIPEDILVVMIKRNGDVFVPNGFYRSSTRRYISFIGK